MSHHPQIRQVRRYVVQLSASERPFDSERVPHLDIFDLYHLYCEASAEHGRMRHTLRLGFFREAGTADTIGRYLLQHFSEARVVPVEAAEVVRSLGNRLVARKDIGASGRHAAIEISGEIPAPATAPPPPRKIRAAPAERSLWSRLTGAR